ncbi:MAG: DUF2094 domain-containing protein [Planctomycetes bacterium]|nr:DUF2094 domain-containing protein [Planctomycetota bacterium]
MSPLKRIIDRLTGQGAPDPKERQLRAFGKLPVSREFLQLEAGQGSGKVVQDWIKAGHESWITRAEARKRGQIAPFCYFVDIPDSKSLVALGCIWNSYDGASPPRMFPFTFFLTQPATAQNNWVGQYLICENYWRQLGSLYEPATRGDVRIQDLREHELQPIDALSDATEAMAEEAAQIELGHWLESLLPNVRCDTPLEYLAFLESRLDGWRRQALGSGLALRLPLSRTIAYRVQVAAWLCWLSTQIGECNTPLTGLFVPQEVAEAEPVLTFVTGPICEMDFQFLTTDARSHDHVEDATCYKAPPESPLSDRHTHLHSILSSGGSIWDWANLRSNSSPVGAA